MKNIYLVKKDPMQPADCNNWIIMNAYEFAQFIKTPDGQRRKDDFGRLSACSENEYTIFAECGYDNAKKWKADQNRQDYVKRVKEEMGISFFSYNSVMVDEDEISGESLIADEDCDVELYVITKIEKENLHKAIELLRCLCRESLLTRAERNGLISHSVLSAALYERSLQKIKKPESGDRMTSIRLS